MEWRIHRTHEDIIQLDAVTVLAAYVTNGNELVLHTLEEHQPGDFYHYITPYAIADRCGENVLSPR